jgi:nucleotide-binding universal stress UspA family protein
MTIPSILLATDLGARCDRALDRAARLAAEWSTRLVVVHAIQEPAPFTDLPSWRRSSDSTIAACKRTLDHDISEHPGLATELVVERGEPTSMIVAAAEKFGCALIITGMARDETFGRIQLGATVETLARQTDVPVLIVKSRPRSAYHHIVVATDFSESSRTAMEAALSLFPTAQFTLFHAFNIVYETYIDDRMAAREAERRQALEQCMTFIDSMPAAVAAKARIHSVCEYGEPGALLRDLVTTSSIQLVVLGTAGRSGLTSMLVESTALRLATEVPVDVLLVRKRRH